MTFQFLIAGVDCHISHQSRSQNLFLYRSTTWRSEDSENASVLKFDSRTCTQSRTRGVPARFQTSNFIGPYNLHRLLLSGLGLLFRSLPIVLLDQS